MGVKTALEALGELVWSEYGETLASQKKSPERIWITEL